MNTTISASSSGAVRVCVAKFVDIRVQVRVKLVAEAVADAGYACTIVGLPSKGGERNIRDPRITYLLAQPQFRWPVILTVFRRIEKLLRYVGALLIGKYDIYCVHDIESLIVVGIKRLFRRFAVIYIGDELEYARNVQGLFGPLRNVLAKAALRLLFPVCDVIMQADISRAEHMARTYRLKKEILVLRNVPKCNLPAVEPVNLHQRLEWPPETVVYMYHGILGHGRGIGPSLKALRQVAKHHSVGLLLFGWGREKHMLHLKALIHEYEQETSGFQGRLFPPMEYEALRAWILGADVGICMIENTSLSYYLAAPSKLYQYMEAGIPVIGSDFPEFRRVFQTADCGLLVNPDDEDEIAAAFLKLAGDARSRKQKGAAGRKAALETYNWEREKAVLLQALKEVSPQPPENPEG